MISVATQNIVTDNFFQSTSKYFIGYNRKHITLTLFPLQSTLPNIANQCYELRYHNGNLKILMYTELSSYCISAAAPNDYMITQSYIHLRKYCLK